MDQIIHVEGENKGHIMLYALSTCGWCKKAKQFLSKMGVEYYYIDVDQLMGTDREDMVAEVKNWNPACSFPTLVINKEKCIVGSNEEKIREAIGL